MGSFWARTSLSQISSIQQQLGIPCSDVPKSGCAICVCGDYRAINERIDDEVYKLPNMQGMFVLLSQNGTVPDMFSCN